MNMGTQNDKILAFLHFISEIAAQFSRVERERMLAHLPKPDKDYGISVAYNDAISDARDAFILGCFLFRRLLAMISRTTGI